MITALESAEKHQYTLEHAIKSYLLPEEKEEKLSHYFLSLRRKAGETSNFKSTENRLTTGIPNSLAGMVEARKKLMGKCTLKLWVVTESPKLYRLMI